MRRYDLYKLCNIVINITYKTTRLSQLDSIQKKYMFILPESIKNWNLIFAPVPYNTNFFEANMFQFRISIRQV